MPQTAEIIPLHRPRSEPSNLHTLDLANADLSSFDISSLLWRRRYTFLFIVFLVSLFSVLAAYLIQPRYEATVRIEIARTADEAIQAWMWPKSTRSDFYVELEIMRSDPLLAGTVERLGLVNDPEFNGSMLRGWADKMASFALFRPIVDLFRSPTEEKPNQGYAATGDLRIATAMLRASLRPSLDVQPPLVSNIIAVTARSIDPKKAANIANTFADIYVSDYVERRVRANAVTRAKLDNRIKEIRKAVARSERAVAEFQTSRRLAASGRNAAVERQFADISTQLMTAKADHAEKKARLSQVYRLRDSEQGIAAAKEVRVSPLIQRLRDQEATLLRRVGELEQNFGERHPKMVNLRAELSAVRQRIREEQVRIVQELENEFRVSRERIDVLTGELNRLDSERLADGQDMVRLRQLQREAEAYQNIYETNLSKLVETGSPGAAAKDDLIQIVSSARPAIDPVYPRKGRIIGLGFVASCGLGIIFILFLERLDNGFRSAGQVESMTGIRVLGTVPRLASAEKDGRAPADVILAASDSPYGEAIRSLRTGLTVSNVDTPPKIVLVASAVPGEGKTSLSVSLARQSAIASVTGNVILIDCDLRCPTVSAAMDLRAEIGLAQLFSGEATWDQVLKIDPKSGLHVLPCTPGTANPPDLLNSRHMRDLLASLADRYDLVIIDSPAVDSVSDARILAHKVDATLFVVQWGATPRRKVIESLRQLASAGANFAGIIIHKADTPQKNQDGYANPSSAG